VYIAEDDPYLREAYRRRFARTRYRVSLASDGEAAAAMIRAGAPDLLICDVMMPGKDGWWVLEQFPRRDRTFPVIMLTNLEDARSRSQGKRLGADDYFVKNTMSLATLVAMADRLLGRPGARPPAR
jgi:DNA-binding response OmpR family regulator